MYAKGKEDFVRREPFDVTIIIQSENSMLVFNLYSWTSPIINYSRPSLLKVVFP